MSNAVDSKNTYAVIMAGGVGSRFWPLSRANQPKQLLPLGGDEPLLLATVRRVQALVPPERVVIVTSGTLDEPIRHMLPDVPPQNVLCEPVGRNTAPCVAWAAAFVAQKDPNAVMAVLPADHYIGDETGYLRVLQKAIEVARQGEFVTVGISPTRVETGYGYIEVGDTISEGVFVARRFVEKPNHERAQQFLAAGNFLWNSGMFFFKAQSMLQATERFLPSLAQGIATLQKTPASEYAAALTRIYPELPAISMDHGIMEKLERVVVLPGTFGWSDLGSWTSAWELANKDANGNSIPNGSVVFGTQNCYVRTLDSNKTVALVGVSDLIVVDTPDALLIVPRAHSQDVRDVVHALQRQGQTDKF